MEDVISVVTHWKEIGGVGVALYLLYRLLVKIVDWTLDLLGINIKRKQSREDVLMTENTAINARLDAVEKRVTRVEGAYKVAASVAHNSADGIEAELLRLGLECPTILFYTHQLRAIQAIEQILKD